MLFYNKQYLKPRNKNSGGLGCWNGAQYKAKGEKRTALAFYSSVCFFFVPVDVFLKRVAFRNPPPQEKKKQKRKQFNFFGGF